MGLTCCCEFAFNPASQPDPSTQVARTECAEKAAYIIDAFKLQSADALTNLCNAASNPEPVSAALTMWKRLKLKMKRRFNAQVASVGADVLFCGVGLAFAITGVGGGAGAITAAVGPKVAKFMFKKLWQNRPDKFRRLNSQVAVTRFVASFSNLYTDGQAGSEDLQKQIQKVVDATAMFFLGIFAELHPNTSPDRVSLMRDELLVCMSEQETIAQSASTIEDVTISVPNLDPKGGADDAEDSDVSSPENGVGLSSGNDNGI